MVRYDRAGKWYLEPRDPELRRRSRRLIGINDAVRLTVAGRSTGRPIGRAPEAREPWHHAQNTRMFNGMGTPAAHCDPDEPALIIEQLAITDVEVLTEARHWSAGRRGPAVDLGELAGADLTAFVRQALSVGARAIAGAGDAQDTYQLEQLVHEVGTRTVESTNQATEATAKAVDGAVQLLSQTSEAMRKAILDSEQASRRGFMDNVEKSNATLRAEVERIFGGSNPELLAQLRPVLDEAGQRIRAQAMEQTESLLAKVGRQFDPADPTSPFAKQAAVLAGQQQALTEELRTHHSALATKVEELARAVEVQKAAKTARSQAEQATTLKGSGFEAEVDAVLERLAVSMGDEYTATGNFPGALGTSKKGDGVIVIGGDQARVVVEMHDSSGPQRQWNSYLEEAERNRKAAASIGIVRDTTQNAGQLIRVLSPRRLIVAFDPGGDSEDLLRTVVLLMRTAAVTASARRDTEGLDTAEENLTAAMDLLNGLGDVKKSVEAIRRNATTIDSQAETLQTGITRHLGIALDALRGSTAVESVA